MKRAFRFLLGVCVLGSLLMACESSQIPEMERKTSVSAAVPELPDPADRTMVNFWLKRFNPWPDTEKWQITAIHFLDTVKDAPENAKDLSETGKGQVLGWLEGSGDDLTLLIGAEGGVYAPKDCTGLFLESCAKEIHFGNAFHTGLVENMSGMFSDCMAETIDLSCFDTSRVTDMSSMFFHCWNLRQADVSSFDTSHVTSMAFMFEGFGGESLDVSNFDTSGVKNMSSMFYGCSVKNLDLRNFNTSGVTDLSTMFQYCSALEQVDLSSFDTSHVVNMRQMFADCGRLRKLDLGNFDTSSVTSVTEMFVRCPSLEEVNVSGFDLSAVTEVPGDLFYGCPLLDSEALYASMKNRGA